MEDLGTPSSYLAVSPGAAVYSSDGKKLGKVEHVLAVPDEHVFDGVVIDTSNSMRGAPIRGAIQCGCAEVADG